MKSLLFACVYLLSVAAAALAQENATFPVGAFTFARPADWEWVPVSSPMRKAQLKVPGEGGQSAEITFFHFGGAMGGDTAANVQRWQRQFDAKEGASKVEDLELSGVKVTVVSTEGTFHSGMPGGPTTPLPDHALLGAILEDKDGSAFVKMTGPKAIVAAARQKFMDFIAEGAKTKK